MCSENRGYSLVARDKSESALPDHLSRQVEPRPFGLPALSIEPFIEP